MIIVLTLVLLSRKEFVIKYLKKPHMNIVNSTVKKCVTRVPWASILLHF